MWGSDLRANWAMLALAIALTLPFIVLPLWLIDWGSGVRGFLLGVSLTALFLGAYHWCVIETRPQSVAASAVCETTLTHAR